MRGHEGPVRSVAIQDGGRWLLTAGSDSTVRLWEVASGLQREAIIFRQHKSPVIAAAFLDNGTQTISGDRDLAILPWKIDRLLATKPVAVPKLADPHKIPAAIPYAKP
jgi:WD40 repeat protein